MTLTEVLQHFDRVDEKKFDEQGISTELHKIVVPDGTQSPFELIAERIAFALWKQRTMKVSSISQ